MAEKLLELSTACASPDPFQPALRWLEPRFGGGRGAHGGRSRGGVSLKPGGCPCCGSSRCSPVRRRNLRTCLRQPGFCACRGKTARVINYEEFKKALEELAPKRFKDKSKEEAYEAICQLVAGKEPINVGVTVSEEPLGCGEREGWSRREDGALPAAQTLSGEPRGVLGLRGSPGRSRVRSGCVGLAWGEGGRGWGVFLTPIACLPAAESQDGGGRGEADGHLQVHRVPQGALRRERQGQGQERAGEHRGHQRLRQCLQERGHLRRQSEKVGTGAHSARRPGPCASAAGPALTPAVGHARVTWGLRWGQPQAGGMSAARRAWDWEAAGPRALPQRYVCVSPSPCRDPPQPLLSPPQPLATGSTPRTNSTAPQGSPAPLAPKPSLPQPRFSGHPPCQSHRGPQPVLPGDLP